MLAAHSSPGGAGDSCKWRLGSQSCVPFLLPIDCGWDGTPIWYLEHQSGFRKRGRRNGVASDFFRFLPFSSVFFRFFRVFFPFSSVFFRFLPFSSVSFSEKNGETPFARPLFQESAKGAGGKGARVTNCHNFFFTPDRETRRIDHTTTEGTAERKMRQFATPAPFTLAPFRPF